MPNGSRLFGDMSFLFMAGFLVAACGSNGNPVNSEQNTIPPPTPPPTPPPVQRPACTVGMELGQGESCTFGSAVFEVRDDGFGCVGGSICAGTGLNLNNFRATKITGTSRWRIDGLP